MNRMVTLLILLLHLSIVSARGLGVLPILNEFYLTHKRDVMYTSMGFTSQKNRSKNVRVSPTFICI